MKNVARTRMGNPKMDLIAGTLQKNVVEDRNAWGEQNSSPWRRRGGCVHLAKVAKPP
jgi:hypothetical protein